MHKHRNFPSRLPSSDIHFTLRRPSKTGATPIKPRKRFADRHPKDRAADREFLLAIITAFGADPFVRGNLDAGRLSWLIDREIIPAHANFNPACYDAELRVDIQAVCVNFPELAKEFPELTAQTANQSTPEHPQKDTNDYA